MGSSYNTDVLGIVYANCRSLAHEVYPASQAHAVLVAQSCSLVACSSVADLKALLRSPRWTERAVTAVALTPHRPQQHQQQELQQQQQQQQRAASLCVWVKEAAEFCDAEAVIAVAEIANRFPDLQFLEISHQYWATYDDTSTSVQDALAAAAPCWQHLQQLKFAKCGPYIAKAVIAGAANWHELQHLDLSGAAMNMSTWVDVAPVLKDLRHLNFRDTITDEYDGAPGFAKAARHWSRLQHVDLSENFFLVDELRTLEPAARDWGQLHDLLGVVHLCLNVRQGGDSVGFARALVDIGQDWQHLKRLDMPNNHLGLDGMQALVLAAQHWLGTSWNRGVRRISLVRLCLGPPAVGFA